MSDPHPQSPAWLEGSIGNKSDSNPSLGVFWEARKRRCFWVTTAFGYTAGAVLAKLSHRLRLSPNCVTAIGFLTALGAVVPIVAGVFESRLAEGLYLGLMLSLSYAWDCADGMLARVTSQAGGFGLVWDKVIDLSSLYVITGALGLAARNSPPPNPGLAMVSQNWDLMFPIFLVTSMAPKAVFSVFAWLKDERSAELSAAPGTPPPTALSAKLTRLMGNLTDEPVFRIGLGCAWAGGFYWRFIVVFQLVIALSFVCYLARTWRQSQRPALAGMA